MTKAKYRLRPHVVVDDLGAEWLQAGHSYEGIIVNAMKDPPDVRLDSPDGERHIIISEAALEQISA